ALPILVAVWVAATGGFRNVRERAVAVVMEKRVRRALEPARAALHVDVAVFAVGSFPKTREIVKVEVHVIGNHQIEETVAVVIAKRSARGPAAIGDARFGRDIGKGPVAIVVVEN